MKDPVLIENIDLLPGKITVIDVRSPAEYARGHIPGAVNIPLFDDEEREAIGILYTQKGRKEAIMKGFEFIGNKTGAIRRQAERAASVKPILVHCWRGGMRSGAMAWLFERQGMQCEVLQGGYKSYRRFLRAQLVRPFRLLILGGMTGTGKTGILREIALKGFQSADLEAIANHRGSAFGALGMEDQPTTEQFENDLLGKLMSFSPDLPIWVEDESRNIGRNIIPAEFFGRMRESPVIVLDMDRKLRMERLVREYGKFPVEDLVKIFTHISKRIGGENAKLAIRSLESGDYYEAADISLRYYDKTYRYGLTTRSPEMIHHLTLPSVSEEENASLVTGYCRSKRLL